MEFLDEMRRREDRRDKAHLIAHSIEIVAIVIFGIVAVWTSFQTTRMQIDSQNKVNAIDQRPTK